MTLYVLKSFRNSDKIYIGTTNKDPQIRLKEHNDGVTRSTRPYRPFQLIYTEQFEDANLARKREKFFKSGMGRQALKNILREIDVSGH